MPGEYIAVILHAEGALDEGGSELACLGQGTCWRLLGRNAERADVLGEVVARLLDDVEMLDRIGEFLQLGRRQGPGKAELEGARLR